MRPILLRDRTEYTGSRAHLCLLCGEIVDDVIATNRTSRRAKLPTGPRPRARRSRAPVRAHEAIASAGSL
jgi:hypothetical protein